MAITKLWQILLRCGTNEGVIDDECVDVFIRKIISKTYDNFNLIDEIVLPIAKDYKYLTDLGVLMKNKLYQKRLQNYGGWYKNSLPIEILYELLENNKNKKNAGNNIDLCNIVMFIYFRESNS